MQPNQHLNEILTLNSLNPLGNFHNLIEMPLVIYKRSNRTHAVFPVTLTTTNSLVTSLIYLQFLYLISYIARPLASSAQELPPFKYHIERTEKRVIDLIISIVPFSNYRSPNPSTNLHHATNNRTQLAAYTSASHLTIDDPMPRPPSTAFTTPPTMPQCHPERTLERLSSHSQDPKIGTPIRKPAAVVDEFSKNNVSMYDTAIERMPPSTRTKVSAIIDLKGKEGERCTQTPAAHSTPALLARQSAHERKFRASIEERSEDENETSLPLHQVRNISETLHAMPSGSKSHLSGLHAGQKSPIASLRSLTSLDGPIDLALALQSLSDISTEGEGVRMDRKTKCHSTESYPGKFPVSEGIEFSGLATAEYAFRERGTTTVRPFSDY
ncbi:hypothetical protein N7520_001141 [Penicillium odoratum]|uniref:uncharacterized protein n=1 Tax=Penicillium odoratum TaxID=1167516 RepID=UPI00254668B1|nr:uncharacterized protein N7520_001141 [Penicillium odoratum]KAJ5777895.1 hypothetical protein N7520_001141 [Penicillium odoratum]